MQKRLSTVRAFFGNRLVPAHKAAGGVVLTAVIGLSVFGFLEKYLSSAKGAFAGSFGDDPLRVLTFRISGASKEFAVFSCFDDHFSSAFFTDDVGLLFRNMDFFAALVFLSGFKGF